MRAGLSLIVASVVLTGCGNSPDAPKQRVLNESQVRAFTDRVLAEKRNSSDATVRALAKSPDSTGGMFGRKSYRSSIEEEGRAVCSHMIAGVPVDQAFVAAYPDAPSSPENLRLAQFADEVLCPD